MLAPGTGLVVGAAPPAAAHATLTGTTPAADSVLDAAPTEVELVFDEPVEVVDDAIRVFGPDGDRVDDGTVETADGGAVLRAPLTAGAEGTYTVAWRVTSEDSHTLSGSFVFHHGTETGSVALDDGGTHVTTTVGGAVGRWLGLAGTLAAVGAATVALLLGRRSPEGGDLTGDGDAADDGLATTGGDGDGAASGDTPAVPPPTEGRMPGHGPRPGDVPGGATDDEALAAGSAGGTATATADPPITVAPATGPVAGVPAAQARLRHLGLAGALVGAMGSLLAVLAVVAESGGRTLAGGVGQVLEVAPDVRTGQLGLLRVALALVAAAAVVVAWRRSPVPALVAAAGALAAGALAGHAWTAPDRGVAVAADLAHLGAVAAWAGGLPALLVALPLLVPGERARLATRFSGLAVAAVAVVATSGTVSGWQQVRTLDGLTSTTYGRLLLAKAVGFAALVVAGWANRSRLVPAVARTVAPLRRSLRVEIVVAAVVLALTAVLVHEPPARAATPAGPYDTTVTAPGGEVVSATVDPATAGTNDIHLYFYGPGGTEPLAVDAVQVTAATVDVPPRRLQVTPVTPEHVTVAGASLPSAGTWTVEVTAVQAGEPLIFTLEVPIA